MLRQVSTALLILAASSAAAAVANATWHKMDWLRRPVAPMPTATTPKTGSRETDDPPPASAAAKPGTVAIDEVLADLASGKAFFIDAREENDYREGHIRGAILLPSSAVYERMDDVFGSGVQIGDKVIVYCGGGDCEASHNVADALRRDFGFTHVLVYTNGWAEIESSGRFDEFITTGDEP